MAVEEEEAGVLINLCLSGKLHTTGWTDFKLWSSSYFRFEQGCTVGFGVLHSQVGSEFGPKIMAGCDCSRRYILTRMLVEINVLPVCNSPVTEEVIT